MRVVYSTNGEDFNEDTLEDLNLESGDTYYTGTVVEVKPSDLLWNIDSVVDQMGEQLYDRLGEVSENFDPTEEQRDKVFTLLKQAVDNYFDVGCYSVKDIEEFVYE